MILGTGFFLESIDTVRGEAIAAPGPNNVVVVVGSYARIWYVTQIRGSDSQGDGSKTKPWKTVKRALQETQDASSKHRYAICVAAGEYQCDQLQMREHVDIYGGFEPTTWERDIFRHATILEGGSKQRILVGADHARLDGFILRKGLVRGQGAALLCDGTSPTVTNNRFAGNRTTKPRSWRPERLHEIAHDGGAICCLHGARAMIKHNTFADNQTEVGRGGAIALHGYCDGKISHNVFLDNIAGTEDEYRSSDGGAISVFNWSRPRIESNVFLENKARNTNDGGALFVALWSSPIIAKNIFAGNRSTDDGGALFVGGQEHRYGKAKDPVPGEERFSVEIVNNVFFGNENGSLNSGGMRLAMDARVAIRNNIMARDARLYVQDSEVEIVNNTILEDIVFRDMAKRSAQSTVLNNIFWGELKLPRETVVGYCNVRNGHHGKANISSESHFAKDQVEFSVISTSYCASEHFTTLKISARSLKPGELANRVVRVDHRWGVVKATDEREISVWGNVSGVRELRVLPTFQLHPESPCIDRGTQDSAPPHDIFGDTRPLGKGVDIGADELVPKPPSTN